MPGWNRKIGQSPVEQDAYRTAKLLEQIEFAASGCCVSTTTTTTTTSAPGLRLLFDNIFLAPVEDPSSTDDWNVFFDLPTNGSPFTSLIISGNEVKLSGGANIIIADSLFGTDGSGEHLVSIIDEVDCVIEVGFNSFSTNNDSIGCPILETVSLPSCVILGDICFANCTSATSFSLPELTTAGDECFANCTSATSFSLPELTTAGDGCFGNCTSATSFSLPSLTTAGNDCFNGCTAATIFNLSSCSSLGSTVGDDSVFLSIAGNITTLTVPIALMTCNAGDPDGDIQYLQANNTVTVITV